VLGKKKKKKILNSQNSRKGGGGQSKCLLTKVSLIKIVDLGGFWERGNQNGEPIGMDRRTKPMSGGG